MDVVAGTCRIRFGRLRSSFLLASDAQIHIQADSDQSGVRFEAVGWFSRAFGRTRRFGKASWAGWFCWANRTEWAMRRRASGFGARECWPAGENGASGSGWAAGALMRIRTMVMVVMMMRRFIHTSGMTMGVAIPAVDCKGSSVSIVGHGRFVRCKVQHRSLYLN
jgi:hypothetical protein